MRTAPDLEQVAEIAAAVAGADLARAVLVEWLVARRVRGVLQVELAVTREGRSVPTQAGLHHAVELVDTERDRLDERGGIADAHEVPGPRFRQVRRGRGDRRDHLVTGLADREPSDAVAVEVELDGAQRALRSATPRRPHPARCRTAPDRPGGARPGRRRPTPRFARRRPGSPTRATGAAGTRRAPSGCRHRATPASATAISGVKRCIDPS